MTHPVSDARARGTLDTPFGSEYGQIAHQGALVYETGELVYPQVRELINRSGVVPAGA